jgi:hypothetical protein
MNAALLGQIAVAVLGVMGATVPLLANRTARKDIRANLQADLSLLGELPPESKRRDELVAHVDASIDRLIADQERKRDPGGVALGLAIIGISIAGGIWVLSIGGWWLFLLIPAALGVLVGSVGLAQDVSLIHRDSSGRPLPSG